MAIDNRYYAIQNGRVWELRDRLRDGRLVGQVWSREKPGNMLDQLNTNGFIED